MLKRILYKSIHPLRQIYWFLFRPKTSGVICLIEHDGRFLMVKNSYGEGHWTLPGGGIKKNESAEQAVIREIKEEVGITLDSVKKIGEYQSTKEYKLDTVYCFYGKTGNPRISIDNAEVLEAAWFTINSIPELTSTATKKVLNLYKS